MAAPLVLSATFDEDYQGLFFNDRSLDLLLDLERGSWADRWNNVAARIGTWEDDPRTVSKRATAPHNDGVKVMTFREEIAPHVQRVLGAFGEFLPVATNDGSFLAFHCLNEVDALDIARSRIRRWADDAPPDDPRILFPDHIAFDEAAAADAKVFTLRQDHGRGSIYFTRPVVEALLDPPGLFTGTTFRAAR